jgi:hypothetical protein
MQEPVAVMVQQKYGQKKDSIEVTAVSLRDH